MKTGLVIAGIVGTAAILAAQNLGPGPGRGRGGGPEGAVVMAPDDLLDTLMAFDRNGDGKLERSEVPERFQGLFDRADTNKDNMLTRDELSAGLAAAGGRGQDGRDGGPGGRGRGPAFPDLIVRALDADGDGVISAAEIENAPAALKALDTNHDGQLTPDEFRPAFGRGRGRGGDAR